MNEKKKSSKQPLPRRRRRRRRNDRIPHDYLAAISKLSERAQVPFDRVKTDVVEFGLAALVEHYRPLIEAEEARALRRKSIQHLFSDEPVPPRRSAIASGPRSETATPELELDSGEQSPAASAQRDVAPSAGEPANGDLLGPTEFAFEPGYRAEVDSDSLRIEPD